MGAEPDGLATELAELTGPAKEPRTGGGSDDIGDISWNVPTVTLRFPSNFQTGGGGHHWSSAVAMATPIAHQGATAGAKVMAMTALDLYLNPAVLEEARAYFERRPNQGSRVHAFHLRRRFAGDSSQTRRSWPGIATK